MTQIKKIDQPFCDIDIPETPLNDIDFAKLVLDLRSRSNRDFKFSDSKLEVTTLELLEIQRYYNSQGIRRGYDAGYVVGYKHGKIACGTFLSLITVFWFIIYFLL